VAAAKRVPTGLGVGGRALWRAVSEHHALDAMQKVTLLEACRAKDRLDRLDQLLRADVDTWATLTHNLRTQDYELKIDSALSQANTTANLMKQLLASLRLPRCRERQATAAAGFCPEVSTPRHPNLVARCRVWIGHEPRSRPDGWLHPAVRWACLLTWLSHRRLHHGERLPRSGRLAG